MDNKNGVGAPKNTDTKLVSAFSRSSAIGIAIFDNQQLFRFVNPAVVEMHHGVPAEAFLGNRVRDVMGDAATEPEARLQRAMIAGETPSAEVCVMLPMRTEPSFFIEKNFTIKDGAGRVTQLASLAIEVTAQRKLEECFRTLCGELLWRKEGYQRLGRELHDSINEYHAALAVSLERLSRATRDPERIPELLSESMEFLDDRMQHLTSAVGKCFAIEQQH